MELEHQAATERIIKAFYRVYNKLGYGFLEKVYERAMAIELGKLGLEASCQHPIVVQYDGQVIGEYFADILVENLIVLELKCAVRITDAHEAQLLNYLKGTRAELGFVLNFGKKAEFLRKIYHNYYK
ncbi:MAG: GxxExxY protein [Bacteroidota bacterium]